MKKYIYMDNAATTQVKEAVLQSMLPFFREIYGNPSADHAFAREAKEAVEKARVKNASLIGAKTDEIFFTSGVSESDNWALKAVAEANESKGKHIITSKIEHHAILHTCEYLKKKGYDITYLDVDEDGKIRLDELEKSIRNDTILISVMAANNEIGTIEPITEIGRIAHDRGVLFHTDAVQAYGHIPLIGRVLREIPDVRLNGHRYDRLPGNANFSFASVKSASLLILLNKLGICASGGSACTSESTEPSHVLTAIGLSRDMAEGALRLTLSEETDKEEIDFVVDNLKEITERLRD